jgi:hypothetical protein
MMVDEALTGMRLLSEFGHQTWYHQAATSELQILLERFANRQSMDVIFDAANVLIDDANMDEELKEWFNTYSNQTAIPTATTFATLAASSMTGNTRVTLTTCSHQSGIGSRI